MNREAIYAALYALIKTAADQTAVTTFERRLRHWNDVPKEEQPYVCLTQGSEWHQTSLPGQRDRVMIKPKLYVYVSTASDLDPGPVINPILDAINALFSPDRADPMQQKQTLGGLVEHVRIDGEVVTFEGTLGDQEVAFIPLELLVVTG